MKKEFICNVMPSKKSIVSRTCKKSCQLTVTSINKIFQHAQETGTVPILQISLPINNKEYFRLNIEILKLSN